MAIFTPVTVGTNDLAKARAFYDAVLAPLGYKRLKDLGDRGSCWGQSAEEFLVLTPADGKPACPANGGTVSFEAPSRAAVDGFHKAALAAGGKDEGAVAQMEAELVGARELLQSADPRQAQLLVAAQRGGRIRHAGSETGRQGGAV